MRLTRPKVLIAAIIVLIVVIVLLLVQCASSASGPIGLPFRSTGWSYRQVTHDAQKGFEKPSFDASTWTVGQAGFGTLDNTCSWNTAKSIHTKWTANTDMLLRHEFRAQTSPGAMHVFGTIDNNADVYVNGTLIQHVVSGSCNPNAIDVAIPAKLLHGGGDNLIAIRAVDVGDATYIDVEIIYSTAASPSPS